MAWKFFTSSGQEKSVLAAAPLVAYAQLYDSTLGVAAASFDVSNISQAYNHLKLVLMGRGDTAATNVSLNIRFNNDSAANYGSQRVQGTAGTASATEQNSATQGGAGNISAASATASFSASNEIFIPCYKDTTFFKTAITTCSLNAALTTGNRWAILEEATWASTAAINRITLIPGSGNFIAGSRLTIYGML